MGTFNWLGPKNIFSPFSLSKKWKSTNFSPFLTFFPLSVTFFLLMIQTFPICHLKGLTNACQYIWSKKYILLKKNSKIRQLRFSNFNLLSMLRHCDRVCSKKWPGDDKKWGKSTKIWGSFKLQYLKLETSFWQTFKG